jgi:hypothetical protein
MRKTISTISLLFFGLSLVVGCARFESPSKEECEQMMDHMMRLTAQEDSGSAFKKRGLEIVGNLLVRATGERNEVVSNCMGTSNRAVVKCVLGSKSTKEAKACD